MDDAELVRRCLDGDTKAFDLLVHRYRERVYGLALQMLGNADWAEDLAQEAFLRAFSRLTLFDPKRGSFSAWLMTMTIRLCLNALKGHAVQGQHLTLLDEADEEEIPMDEAFPNPEEIFWAQERRAFVRQLLAAMPPMQRAALLLRYGEEMSVQEVAETLKVPVGTVKAWLFRGRESLRRKFKEVGLL